MSQIINVDLTPNDFQPILNYSQGDVGTEFTINLTSRFGIEAPSNATVTIQATKPSGFGFSVNADSFTDGKATFTTTAEMTDEWGKFPAELKVVSGGVTRFSANFLMLGERNVHPDGTMDGQQGSVIPELTLLVERIEDAADSIHNLTVDATTLAYDADATATYNGTTNNITFGIPRGGLIDFTDSDDGDIVISLT